MQGEGLGGRTQTVYRSTVVLSDTEGPQGSDVGVIPCTGGPDGRGVVEVRCASVSRPAGILVVLGSSRGA